MKIVFTKHARKKFLDLRNLGINISVKQVRNVLKNPENIDNKSDFPNSISSGKVNSEFILKVVHKMAAGDKILVITFYPAKTGRYY